MPAELCPECGETGRALPPVAAADYFYCDACRTAWYFDRSDPLNTRTVIATPKKDRRRPSTGSDVP